jgi:hypothetical protein
MNKKYLFTIAISALVISMLACGTATAGGQVVSTSSGPTATTAPMQVNKIGDVVAVGTQTITLNSAKVTASEVQANFTVENTGTSSLVVSSIASFEAKTSDGTKLDQDMMGCSSGSMDGTVLAGDKLKGDICWTGAITNSVKIYYTPELFGGTVIVWEVTK